MCYWRRRVLRLATGETWVQAARDLAISGSLVLALALELLPAAAMAASQGMESRQSSLAPSRDTRFTQVWPRVSERRGSLSLARDQERAYRSHGPVRLAARRAGVTPHTRPALAARSRGRRGSALARGIRRRARGRSPVFRSALARRSPGRRRARPGSRARRGSEDPSASVAGGSAAPRLHPVSFDRAPTATRPFVAGRGARRATHGAGLGPPSPTHWQGHPWRRHARVRLRQRRPGALFRARRGFTNGHAPSSHEGAPARSIRGVPGHRARGRSPAPRRARSRRGPGRRRARRGSRARRGREDPAQRVPRRLTSCGALHRDPVEVGGDTRAAGPRAHPPGSSEPVRRAKSTSHRSRRPFK